MESSKKDTSAPESMMSLCGNWFQELENVVDPDELLWDKLIQQILDGNVIPVIGVDMLVDQEQNPHEQIVQYLSKKLRLSRNVTSFSELVYTSEYAHEYKQQEQIYYLVDKMAQAPWPPSQKLQRLLSVKQFPFVITTSFTPVVEQAMRAIWKDQLKVLKFTNNPAENEDIRDEEDLHKPTIYYMFGKAGSGMHRYVLTDVDMLDFVSSWLSNVNKVSPKNLCNALKGKYLLMLGNNYSNWLFRFIWYSMRNPEIGPGMLAYDEGKLDQELVSFLDRTEHFTKGNTSDVIDQIVTRLNKKLAENQNLRFNKPEENMDVFISYSRSDSAMAEKVYNILTNSGKRVWYDRYHITEGGDFMEEIHKAIKTARYFIPILTENITKEKNEVHVYRNEWDYAIDVATATGRTYMIPLAESTMDFYNAAIPEKMQKKNAVMYSCEDELEDAIHRIISKMNQD